MNTSKRNTEMTAKTFWSLAVVATVVLLLSLNAAMNKMEARRVAEEHLLNELCEFSADGNKRPLECINWDNRRCADCVSPPRG